MNPAFLTFLCIVTSVTDGDTWRCENGQAVRMWGASAPELREPGGQDARDWLKGEILGRQLWCEVRGGSYNRIVARCSVIGADVATLATGAGHAADCPRYSGGVYAREGVAVPEGCER